jgi:hypothetical protein
MNVKSLVEEVTTRYGAVFEPIARVHTTKPLPKKLEKRLRAAKQDILKSILLGDSVPRLPKRLESMIRAAMLGNTPDSALILTWVALYLIGDSEEALTMLLDLYQDFAPEGLN